MAEILRNSDGTMSEVTQMPSATRTNSALTLGIIGTALAGMGILGASVCGIGKSNSRTTTDGGSETTSMANSMTSEDLYIERKQCQNYLDITKQYYEGKLATEERFANLFFDAYKRDVDNSFQLYKYTRDNDDALAQKINEVDKKVDVMAAIRPYQDALIDNKINTNAILAQYALDKRTCRMIEGQLVLPSTPSVTGFGSYSSCPCVNAAE